MKTLYKNIKQLVQVRREPVSFISGKEMSNLPYIENAWLLVNNGIIADFGKMENASVPEVEKVVDCSGKLIMPCWCDSHTHLVYAGNRESEFVDRIKGLSYEEIANRGGGILNSAKKLRETPEDELYEQSKLRIKELMQMGTGAVEIKSGYGLTLDSELKMLRVIKRLSETCPLKIKATFLGAHALPAEYKNDKEGYLNLIIDEILPELVKEELAEYIDVFCEKGYFSVADTEKLLAAGQRFGLIPKIHVNQFNAIGGIEAAVKYKALSVDHLEELNDSDIESLKNSKTMPVALPGCSFFLSIPYTPARKLIDNGLPMALASDFNPGSNPSGNMNLVVATACIKMNMNPEEAINAATINSAYAMGIENELGSITVGKKANLIITKPIHSYSTIAYAYGTKHIDKVMIGENSY